MYFLFQFIQFELQPLVYCIIKRMEDNSWQTMKCTGCYQKKCTCKKIASPRKGIQCVSCGQWFQGFRCSKCGRNPFIFPNTIAQQIKVKKRTNARQELGPQRYDKLHWWEKRRVQLQFCCGSWKEWQKQPKLVGVCLEILFLPFIWVLTAPLLIVMFCYHLIETTACGCYYSYQYLEFNWKDFSILTKTLLILGFPIFMIGYGFFKVLQTSNFVSYIYSCYCRVCIFACVEQVK